MQLKDKNIFITGSNRGIGFAFAEEAARRGANITHLVRNQNSIDADHFVKLGASSCRTIELDLLERQMISQVATEINQGQYPVDVLINNAGLLTGGLIEEQDTQAIYRAIQVNLTGLIHLTKELLPPMIARKKGLIVNNASVSGKMFFPCASTYAATKAGVVAFTESIKQELEPTGVRTLLLITSGVKTEMYDDIKNQYGKNLELDFLSSIPGEEWAKTVFNSIVNGDTICWPPGSSRFGVFLGHHFPGLFQRFVKGKFSR